MNSKIKNFISRNKLFLFIVALPFVLSLVYFTFIASDIYVSEAKFIVKSTQNNHSNSLSMLFQGSGLIRSQEDVFTVQEYMLSRDALTKLNLDLKLSRKFANRTIDFLNRFPSLDGDSSFEALHKHYQKHVSIASDPSSSIATLKVSAYNAEDSYKINSALLELAEKLVNQLNERNRNDVIQSASKELAYAEIKVSTAALALANFRNDKTVFDPDKQSALQLQQVAKIQEELVAHKARLAQLKSISPNSPQIFSIEKAIQSLEKSFDQNMAKVTGANSSYASKSVEYERLQLDRVFAEKQLAASFANLEQAKNEAQRKQIYLERIVQPNMPDVAVGPRRVRAIVVVLVLSLLLWGVLLILLAGVREHQG